MDFEFKGRAEWNVTTRPVFFRLRKEALIK